jgi:hypothetical protein
MISAKDDGSVEELFFGWIDTCLTDVDVDWGTWVAWASWFDCDWGIEFSTGMFWFWEKSSDSNFFFSLSFPSDFF